MAFAFTIITDATGRIRYLAALRHAADAAVLIQQDNRMRDVSSKEPVIRVMAESMDISECNRLVDGIIDVMVRV